MDPFEILHILRQQASRQDFQGGAGGGGGVIFSDFQGEYQGDCQLISKFFEKFRCLTWRGEGRGGGYHLPITPWLRACIKH